jgi:cell division protein FtsW
MIEQTSEEKRPDIILLVITLILVTVGTAMIYSSSSILAMERFKDAQYFLKKQILFVLLGLSIMVLFLFPMWGSGRAVHGVG